MVLPTGTRPVQSQTDTNSLGVNLHYWAKVRRWQAAPFDLVLPYDFVMGDYRQNVYTNYFGSGLTGGAENMPDYMYDPSYMIRASNQAYESLKGKISAQAQLGAAFAELGQSYTMIEKAATTIVRSMRAVKKGQFGTAASILGMKAKPPSVSRKKAWSDNWLEYHFGWTPLIGDCYEAAKVLSDPKSTYVAQKGYGQDMHQYNIFSSPPGNSVNTRDVGMCYYQCWQGCFIEAVTNRTLNTLSQLGLLNPAVVAWEVIPFSFVADWFGNLGNVLQSFSDFAGVRLGGSYTSTLYRQTTTRVTALNPGYPNPGNGRPMLANGSGVRFRRTPSLTGPVLSFRNLTLPSKERAFTAAALVVQVSSNRSNRGWVAYNTTS
jgi:hypothetical protein